MQLYVMTKKEWALFLLLHLSIALLNNYLSYLIKFVLFN